jgi:hypothetical protein
MTPIGAFIDHALREARRLRAEPRHGAADDEARAKSWETFADSLAGAVAGGEQSQDRCFPRFPPDKL